MRKMLFVAVMSLMVVAVLAGCGKSSGPMDFVPGSAVITGEVDFTKLLAIQKVKEAVIDKQAAEPQAVELQKIGLTPDKVTRIAFGVDLSQAAGGGAPEGVVIIQLSAPVTDEAKAIELLAKEDLQVQFLGGTMMAIGTAGMVAQAGKLKGGEGVSVKQNAALMAVADKASKTGLLWVAAQVPADQLKKLGAAAGPGAPVSPEQIKSLVLSGDYSDAAGLSLKIAVQFDTDKTVTDLLPKLEQAKGMAAMFSGGKVTGDMIKTEQKGAELVITIAIPKAVLDQLADQAKSQTQPPPQPQAEPQPQQ
jgi:predicted small lipoprotein YifL